MSDVPEHLVMPQQVAGLVESLAKSLELRDMYYGGELSEQLCATLRAAVAPDDQSRHAESARGSLRRFAIVAIVDARLALSSHGTLEFDELVDIMGRAILRAKGIDLGATRLHPEDLTQLLKDEKRRILICIFSVRVFTEAHLQRLRGLGLTQTEHRVLYCGFNEYLHRMSVETTSTESAGQPEWRDHGASRAAALVVDYKRVILVVEDHAREREKIRRILVDNDFDVETAGDYHGAVRYLSRMVPTMVVIDLALPRESGLDLCEYIRRDVRYRFVPLLVISDRSSPEDMAQAEYVGANAFLKKPFSGPKLLKFIATLLEHGRGVNHGSRPSASVR